MGMPRGSVTLVFQLCVAVAGPRALAQPAAKPLEFEVASVTPADPGGRSANVTLGAGESLTVINVPLRKIITYAYDVRDFQLAGGPGWVGDERYDIVAKTSAEDRAAFETKDETDEQRKDRVARVRERLRSLLSDRFGLRVHVEQRDRTILALRIANGGPKLTQATAKTDDQSGRVSLGNGHIQGYAAPFSMLVPQLSTATGMTVEDETGMRGRYDFVLDWAPDEKDQSDNRPSIFSAVVEQLGLRLERAKGPVKTVVIDQVERPSAN
jgi:bla regulator protein blaR1